MEKQYITHEALAAAFNVNRATVTKWKKLGVPCIQLNLESKKATFRFSVDEVAAWLKERAAAGKEVQA